MIITGSNLDLFYYNKHKSCFEKYKEIENKQIGYEFEAGQNICKITYDGISSNQLLKFNCFIKDIDSKGILFIDWNNEEIFYQWELNYKNYFGKIDKMKLVICPCDYLFEKYPIKKLIKGEVEEFTYSGSNDIWLNKIWYKHGGWRTISKHENNLKNFKILGQQELKLGVD